GQAAGFSGGPFEPARQRKRAQRRARAVPHFDDDGVWLRRSGGSPSEARLGGQLGELAVIDQAVLVGRHRDLAREAADRHDYEARVDGDDDGEEGDEAGQHVPALDAEAAIDGRGAHGETPETKVVLASAWSLPSRTTNVAGVLARAAPPGGAMTKMRAARTALASTTTLSG